VSTAKEYCMDTKKAYFIVFIITLIFAIPMSFIYFSIWYGNWNFNSSTALSINFTVWNIVLGLLILFALSILHELLHAIGFLIFGNVNWSDIAFGVKWKSLTPFGYCKIPVTALVYGIALILPTLLLGVIPLTISLLIKAKYLFLIGTLMIVGGFGDLIVVWMIRAVPKERMLIDHPSKLGCVMVEG
jgi:hypothetical protein